MQNMTKQALRKSVLRQRRETENKAEKDNAIAAALYLSEVYQRANAILCYASLDDEIATDAIINHALRDGKRVAVPYCTDKNGHMDFYWIDSLNQLVPGSFHVREPDIAQCERLTDASGSIILVPALCFDRQGFRLGYGKGYYDRFLKDANAKSIAICFKEQILKNSLLPITDKDVKVQRIITE